MAELSQQSQTGAASSHSVGLAPSDPKSRDRRREEGDQPREAGTNSAAPFHMASDAIALWVGWLHTSKYILRMFSFFFKFLQ